MRHASHSLGQASNTIARFAQILLSKVASAILIVNAAENAHAGDKLGIILVGFRDGGILVDGRGLLLAVSDKRLVLDRLHDLRDCLSDKVTILGHPLDILSPHGAEVCCQSFLAVGKERFIEAEVNMDDLNMFRKE